MMRGAEAREQDEVTYAWLFVQSKAQHGRIVALSALCTVQAAVLVSFALACRAVIDQAVAGNIDSLLASAAVLAGVIIAQLVLRLAINSTQERIRARFALELRKSMLDSIFAARFGNILRASIPASFPTACSPTCRLCRTAWRPSSRASYPCSCSSCSPLRCSLIDPTWWLFAAAALLSFVLARTLRGRLKGPITGIVRKRKHRARGFCKRRSSISWSSRSFGAQPATVRVRTRCRRNHFTRADAPAAEVLHRRQREFLVLLQHAVRRGTHVVRVRACMAP